MKLETLEKQVADWSDRVAKHQQIEILKVIAECLITQSVMMYNINENISLIRDMIDKR